MPQFLIQPGRHLSSTGTNWNNFQLLIVVAQYCGQQAVPNLAAHSLPVLKANAYGKLEAEQKPKSKDFDFRKSLALGRL